MVGEGCSVWPREVLEVLENTHYDHTHTHTHPKRHIEMHFHSSSTVMLRSREANGGCEVRLCPMAHGNDGFCWTPQNLPSPRYRSSRTRGEVLLACDRKETEQAGCHESAIVEIKFSANTPRMTATQQLFTTYSLQLSV